MAMYRVKPDGTIETSSAEEALDLQRMIHEREAKKQRKASVERTPSLFVSHNGEDSEFIKKLIAHNGTEINSETMKDIIGAKTVAGVGPKLYHIRRAHPEIESMLEEQRDERGIVTWKVRAQ